MPRKTVTVSIEDVDEQTDSMRVYVEGTGYPVALSRFREMITGSQQMDSEHLLRNVAIRAALSNVDISNINSIKAAIEGVPFKV